MKYGIAASPGIGIGKVKVIKEENLEYENRLIENTDEEIKRFENALSVFYDETEKSANEMRGRVSDSEIDIIRGHIVMIQDPIIISEIEEKIIHGECAELALEEVCNVFINVFSNTEDELIRMRAADVNDIKRKMLKILLGIEETDLTKIEDGTIIAVSDIVPSLAAQLKKEKISGILTEKGGVTSHSAILLRAMGIPAVFGVSEIIKEVNDGDTAVLNGEDGSVYINPSCETLSEYNKIQASYIEQHKLLQNYKGKPSLTKDGIHKKIVCNIRHPEDAESVLKNDGEGIGLFRSEYLFMDRDTFPTEKEQFNAYKSAVNFMKSMPVTIRTLDIGGDKEIIYAGLKKEDNPFLGLRAIRYSLKYIEKFHAQLRAIIRSGAYGDVRIMIPLITRIDEIRKVREEIKKIECELKNEQLLYTDNIKIGAMIETPAACAICDILAEECDFFSIGTNDLIQYTMAVDRGSADVAYIYSPYDPAVLRSIKHIISVANGKGIPVSMCGEMSSDTLAVPLLISFGLDEFSVSPNMVLKIRRAISLWSKSEADIISEKAMSLKTADEVKAYLESVKR